MEFRKTTYLLLFSFLLFACKKDELEGSTLQPNPFEEQTKPIFEITAKQYADCSVIFMDLKVLEENLPDTLRYTHFQVEDPFGHTFITQKTTRIATASRCNQRNEYRVALYNDDPIKVSFPQTFVFE